MNTLTKGLGLIILADTALAAGGCYGSAMSVARCAAKYGKIRFRAPRAFVGGIDLGAEFGSTAVKISPDARDRWTRGHKTGSTGSGSGKLSLHTEFGSV